MPFEARKQEHQEAHRVGGCPILRQYTRPLAHWEKRQLLHFSGRGIAWNVYAHTHAQVVPVLLSGNRWILADAGHGIRRVAGTSRLDVGPAPCLNNYC